MENGSTTTRLLIYGAGVGGELVVQELLRNPDSGVTAVAFIDDDPAKAGQTLLGLPVENSAGSLKDIMKRHDAVRVLLAMPSIPGQRIHEIHRRLINEEIPAMIVPSLVSIVSGRLPITTFRNVNPIDFIRRHPRVIERGSILQFLKGKHVCVTGAGGTIGSELVRQLSRLPISRLTIVDQSETAIYHLVENDNPDIPMDWHLTDLAEKDNVLRLFKQVKPDIIFHAAAYKHVHLLEGHPEAAVLNNIGTTRWLIDEALNNDIEAFVNISTDKAIQPTSIMGSTKRICELMLQDSHERSRELKKRTRLISVRFGNVLGSSGSVFLKFTDQIQQGLPVTVTDPKAKRYFMLDSEAAELVLQAGGAGESGKIYLLDMGEAINIYTMAEDLIRFFGKDPGNDIPIQITGLRPGEKLEEDLSKVPTKNTNEEHLLEVVNGYHPQDKLIETVDNLLVLAKSGDRSEMMKIIRELVPEAALHSEF